MSSISIDLAEDQTFVEGRSQEKAQELLGLAEQAGLAGQVSTTSFGYIVPTAIFGETKKSAKQDESTPEEKAENPEGVEFDPSAATVDEVKDYLEHADDTERQRVLDAETAGKGRKGILDLATTPEGAK